MGQLKLNILFQNVQSGFIIFSFLFRVLNFPQTALIRLVPFNPVVYYLLRNELCKSQVRKNLTGNY